LKFHELRLPRRWTADISSSPVIRPARAKKALRVSVWLYLVALTLTFGYAVLQSGGIFTEDWDRCVVSLGLLVLVYFGLTKKSDLAPALESWFSWPVLLLLGFIGLQLVPLPASLLQVISPRRAALLRALQGVSAGIHAAPISVFPPGTLAHLLRVASYVAVLVLVRELAWRTLRRRWVVVFPIMVIAGAQAALGVFQFDWLTPVSPAHGTYLSGNHFAGLLELSLPFAVVYPIFTIRTRRRSLGSALLTSASLALAALILLGILFSLSRMGFVASVSSLFVVACLTVAMGTSGRKRFAAVGIVGGAVIAISLYLIPDPLIYRFDQVVRASDTTPDPRLWIWKDTWALARDYPLVGSGLGTFEQAFQKYKTFAPRVAVDSVRNDYLQLLVELGGFGFTIAASAMLVVLVSAARAVVESVRPATRYLAVACIGALVAVLVHSLTDYNLYVPANAMLLAWISGAVASLDFDSQATFISG